jgi:tetratricopeptide (TPR) repeat protein
VSRFDADLASVFVSGMEATLARIKAADPAHELVSLGQVYEIARMHDAAERAYGKAIDHPDHNVALEALARYVIVLLKQDRRADALTHAEHLAATAPDFKVTSVLSGETYTSMTLLGDALFVNERFESAAKAYDQALKMLPKDPYVSGRLALLHLAAGEEKDAVRLIDAVESSPRYAHLTNTLKLVKSGLLVGRIDRSSALAAVMVNMPGRPFRVEQARTAHILERDDWA